MKGYSIDETIYNTFIKISLAFDEVTLKLDDDKEIANIKFLFQFFNQLLVDDRSILYKWKPYNLQISYPYVDLIQKKAEKYFTNAAKYEAIHALVRKSGTNIKAILKNSDKQMSQSKEFEENLNKFARITENREQISIFSLDLKHISHFNPFYFRSGNEHTESIKNFNEFYKSKIKKSDEEKAHKNNPLRIQNSSLGFFIAMIRESIMKTELIRFLINLLKYRDNTDFVDPDVEEYATHLLKLLFDYVYENENNLADVSVSTKIKNICEEEKEFFNNIRKEPQFSALYISFSSLIKTEGEENKEEEKKSKGGKVKKKMDRKKMAEKMRQKALMKMNQKRGAIADKFGMNTETSSNMDSASAVSAQEVDIPK